MTTGAALVEGDAAPAAPADDATTERIAAVAAELRAGLSPLIEALAGSPPRPVRLMRRIGLDKSLASRLVQAMKADSDGQFLHAAPSPTGLRMLVDASAGAADATLRSKAAAAIDNFEALLDTLPGGRQALDALLGATSASIRRKREQVARQAAFKAQSFLFGHYCETLVTTLFVVPSALPGRVELMEVHRRVGLQRLISSAPVPLMSLLAARPSAPATEGAAFVTDLAGDATTRRPEDFLLASASSAPLPPLRVVDEGTMVSFVLEPAPPSRTPQRLSSALRVLHVAGVEVEDAFISIRRYMLHTPCSALVRDIYVAEGLWPGARLQVGFYLPGPTGSPDVRLEPGVPHHRQLHLSCEVQPLPPGKPDHALPGVPDQARTLHDALARAGLDTLSFRGWRCTMSYPVPLVEMQIAFRFRD